MAGNILVGSTNNSTKRIKKDINSAKQYSVCHFYIITFSPAITTVINHGLQIKLMAPINVHGLRDLVKTKKRSILINNTLVRLPVF